jgi:xanthine dehydrogenase YagS FAD-binding subunit
MKAFTYVRAADVSRAVSVAAREPDTVFLAGGTNLVDLMKEGVSSPGQVVDINRLGLNRIEALPDGGVRLGALARNSDTASHPLVRSRFPLVAQAILAGASGQLRNAATNGGNLRQRTRCSYFYDISQPCNKREAGSGCGALDGFNRTHAILGASDQCVATYPGDMAQALHALDAIVQVTGPEGRRNIPVTQFHRLPGNTPQQDANLQPGDLITAIDLPGGSARFADRSSYIKVRDRASYAFALVSVAAALDVEGGRIREARVCLGSVAHKPWRSQEAEAALKGGEANAQVFRRAAEAALSGARGLKHNTYKIEMTKRAVVRALETSARASA